MPFIRDLRLLGLTLVTGGLLAACAEDESGASCRVETIDAPDSVQVLAAGANCLLPGPDSTWEFTWRLPATPNFAYAIRAFRTDTGIATPWAGSLTLLRRPPGGGAPEPAASPWGTYGPLNDRVEALLVTDSAAEFLVRVLAPRAEDGGTIALVVERCPAGTIVPPDTLPAVDLTPGCVSYAYDPGRTSRVSFLRFDAPGPTPATLHLETVRSTGGSLFPAAAGPGADLGCTLPACLHHIYPRFVGTLGHSIVPPVTGRYTYLLGVDADSAGLAVIRMVPQ